MIRPTPAVFAPLLLATTLLAACQGAPATTAAAPSPTPPGPAAPGTGECVAPAIVVDAGGKASLVKTGSAAAAAGICVPARDLGAGPADAVSVGGGYRVSLESPDGRPDATNPRGRLRAAVRSASGGQSMVVDATVRFVLFHVEMGGGHGFDPKGVPAVQEADGYVLTPLAWPMAGLWLVTVMIEKGGVTDHAYFAVDVK